MSVITRKALIAKNKAGDGLRKKENHDALVRLKEIFRKAAEHVENDSLDFNCNLYAESFEKLTDPRNRGQIPLSALGNLDAFEHVLNMTDSSSKRTNYQDIVSVLPEIGATKEEFDDLLKTANTVLELGLEKSVFKPKDPQEEERLRREKAEQDRREQERRERERVERERLERERVERERIERERLERERTERERLERERLERERVERERLHQLELERQREEQRKQQRVDEIRRQNDALMNEDFENTDYTDPEIEPLKLEPDAQLKVDAVNRLEEAEANENILEGEKERVRKETEKILGVDYATRRKQEKEDRILMNEADAKLEKPLEQTKTVMISQELDESFHKRFPPSDDLVARTSSGKELKGTFAILHALGEESGKLYIDVPDDPEHRCTCLEGRDGRLYVSARPVGFKSDPDLVRADYAASFDSDFDALFEENEIGSAVDTEGNVYTEKETMRERLSRSGSRLMLMGRDKDFVIALGNIGGELYSAGREDLMTAENVNPYRIPDKTTLLGVDQDDILYAESPDGRRFDSPDAIRAELRDPDAEGRLHLYTKKDPESAYLVRYRHGEAVGISQNLIHESELKKASDDAIEPADMSEIEEKRILNWKESDITYAVDSRGRRYEGPEAIKTALYGEDKNLQLYTKGEELPFAVQKKNNRFYISAERVPKFEDQTAMLAEQLEELEPERFESVNEPVSARQFLEKSWSFDEASPHAKMLESRTGVDFSVRKTQFDFALDENGRMYKDPNEVAALLDKPDDRTLFIFGKDKEPPFAVQKKDGMLYKSDDRISTRNIMPETERFEPKKSLHVNDIVHVADKSKVFRLKEQTDDLGMEYLFYEKNIKALKKASEKPEEPQKPKKPTLGFWNSIAYGFTWFFTAGRVETEAHRLLPIKRKRYEEDLALYPSRMETYRKELKAHKDYLNGGKEKLEEYEKKMAEVKARRDKVKEERTLAEREHAKAMIGNDVGDVKQYRNKLETRMEGVNDYRTKSVVTPQNVFAYTWLKEAECRNKPASDPDARKAFCEWFASSKLENELLEKRVNSEQLSDPVEERKLEQINNGTVVKALMNDKDLKALFDKMGSAPIDPEKLKEAYTEKVVRREIEKKDDIKYLENARERMIETFGKKTVDPADEKTLETVLRYRMLQQSIKSQKNLPPTTDPARIEARFKEAQSLESNAYRSMITEADKYPFRKAFEALQGREMKLDEMSTALDSKKKELDLAAEGPKAQA